MRAIALDAALLAVLLGFAVALFFQGGLEALIGAGAGAFIGFRNAPWRSARLAAALSGAFAGLFAGALFAGCFHGAIVVALSAIV